MERTDIASNIVYGRGKIKFPGTFKGDMSVSWRVPFLSAPVFSWDDVIGGSFT